LKLMLWGLFKKIVIADRLAFYVNAVYNNVEQHSGLTLLLATLFFTFQIYCDFSGYTDIAIGVARVMGYDLMKNFNRPYFARSISEFWSRWHISLSTWFKDYLYISLGGSRVSVPKWYFNLMLVFLISGFWHGANWTYLVWGGLNGFYLIFARLSQNFRGNLNKKLGFTKFPIIFKTSQILITFILITFAWIFFRANTITDAFLIIRKIAALDGAIFIENPSKLIFCFMGIGLLFIIELKREFYKGKFSLFDHQNWMIRNLTYASLIIMILLFGVFDGGQFIYFQF
jgi:alginate O-acetyltransferase complex protein AlgI